MKNYIQPGKSVKLTAPSGGVVGGKGYVARALFVVAGVSAAEGESYDGFTEGVYELAKNSGVDFSVGEKVYFDGGNAQCDDTDTGFFMIGVATEAAGTSDTTVKVRLDGVAVTAVA